MKSIKAQGATEFLSMYGWVIFVVILALGAISFSGVLKPQNFMADECDIPHGMDCIDYYIFNLDEEGEKKSNVVALELSNELGSEIEIVAFEINSKNLSCTSMHDECGESSQREGYFFAIGKDGPAIPMAGNAENFQVKNGEPITIVSDWCTQDILNVKSGDKEKIEYTIKYRFVKGSNKIHSIVGNLRATAQPLSDYEFGSDISGEVDCEEKIACTIDTMEDDCSNKMCKNRACVDELCVYTAKADGAGCTGVAGQCNDGYECIGGTCMGLSLCNADQCCFKNFCVNTNSNCGPDCITCGAGETCVDGVCTVLVCTDVDADGYNQFGVGCGPEDCNDDEPFVNPGETEICANGIDDNCDGDIDEGCAGPVCGDGTIDPGEFCDDGNTANGDGCSDACVIEECYACKNEPSVCVISPGGIIQRSQTMLRDAYDIQARGDGYAYITGGQDRVTELDISNPSNPTITDMIIEQYSPKGIEVINEYAYTVTGSFALAIFDINNPADISLVGRIDYNDCTPANCLRSPVEIDVEGDYAYIIGRYGLDIVNIATPSNPIHMSTLTDVACDAACGGVNDCCGLDNAENIDIDGNLAYIAGGTDDSIEVIDVSNPAAPIHYNTVTYCNGGFPTCPGGKIDAMAHNPNTIRVVGNYAYITTCEDIHDSEFVILDVSDPLDIDHVNTIEYDQGEQNGYCPRDVQIDGNLAYITYDGYGGVDVWDITNKANPVLVNWITYNWCQSAYGTICPLRKGENLWIDDNNNNIIYVASSDVDGYAGMSILEICGSSGPVCGDGLVSGSEVCDDGDTDPCGDCNADCTGPGSGPACCMGTPTFSRPTGAEACSSINNPGQDCDKAHDGSSTTGWFSLSSYPQWEWFDLGEVKCVSGVRISTYGSYTNQRARIQVSDDASTWTTVHPNFYVQTGVTWDERTFAEASGRYVRVYYDYLANLAAIKEIEIETRE